MTTFRGIGSKSNDILRNGYCHDKAWTVAATRNGSPRFATTACLSPSNTLDATPSVRLAGNGLVVEARSGNSGAGCVDVKYEFPKGAAKDDKVRQYLAGLTLGTKFERKIVKSATTDATELSAELKRDRMHSRLFMNPSSRTWGCSECATFEYNGSLAVGCEVSGSGKDTGALNYSVGAGFSRTDGPKPWWATIKGSPAPGGVGISKITTSFCAATEAGHCLAAEVQHDLGASTASVTIGGMAYISPKKETWVKVKVMPNADVAAVLCHKFSDTLTGSFGCQFAGAGQSPAQPVKYGMKLALTA